MATTAANITQLVFPVVAWLSALISKQVRESGWQAMLQVEKIWSFRGSTGFIPGPKPSTQFLLPGIQAFCARGWARTRVKILKVRFRDWPHRHEGLGHRVCISISVSVSVSISISVSISVSFLYLYLYLSVHIYIYTYTCGWGLLGLRVSGLASTSVFKGFCEDFPDVLGVLGFREFQ